MKVWEEGKDFQDILKNDPEINEYFEHSDIELICNLENRLKNVNYIFKKLKLI